MVGGCRQDWPINSVDIGLNEDCWLGINGMPAAYSGANYINFIKSEVAAAEADHIYPVIFPFRYDPGSDVPNGNDAPGYGMQPMLDNDHGALLWEEIASAFKGDGDVIFRAMEEPFPEGGNTNGNSIGQAAWTCWSEGDVQYSASSDQTLPANWESAPDTSSYAPTATGETRGCQPENVDDAGNAYYSLGVQSIVNIIRGVGATNVIQLPGIEFANLLSCDTGALNAVTSPSSCGFLEPGVEITDPLATTDPGLGSQLAADVDMYPGQRSVLLEHVLLQRRRSVLCSLTCRLDVGEAGVIGSAPSTSSFPLLISFIDWMDSEHESNYYAAAWDTWSDLISSYTGTPGNGVWGDWYYNHITGYASVLPVNTVVPSITGTAAAERYADRESGHVDGSDVRERSDDVRVPVAGLHGSTCSNIAGATSSSYTPQASDVGDTLDVVVTATDDAGSTSATSARTSTVITNGGGGGGGGGAITPMPLISRNPQAGTSLPVYYPGGPADGDTDNALDNASDNRPPAAPITAGSARPLTVATAVS